MRRKQFKEDQIVRILGEFEKGKSIQELCREYNVARSTIYMWRKKYGGIDKPMLKKLKELEKEYARLKKIVAQQAMLGLCFKGLSLVQVAPINSRPVFKDIYLVFRNKAIQYKN